jgi:hypothetical protein
MNFEFIDSINLDVGDKIMVVGNHQVMVIEVLPSPDGGLLVYRSPRLEEIMRKITYKRCEK